MIELDEYFWNNPPWGKGDEKYRLGLKPIEEKSWLIRKISKKLLNHKKNLLKKSYEKVIATTDGSNEPQKILAKIFNIKETFYPDLIAEIGLHIQDDLCLIEAHGEQRLIAASVCSPSYWDLRKKIGKPLRDIHGPITTLNEKIGDRIEKFIKQAPVMRPFARENWLIHGDTKRLHLKEEKCPSTHPSEWFIRSERETLCRFHENFSLFTINVFFQPLKLVHSFPEARAGLIKSINKFDQEEADYFGGDRKIMLIKEYLQK